MNGIYVPSGMSLTDFFAGLLVIHAGIWNAIMDISAEGRFRKCWWNKKCGAPNKWRGGNPKNGEKFPLSSTVLVFATDGWHLAQLFFHSSWQLAIALYTDAPVFTFIILKTLFSIIFEDLYRYLKKKHGK